ncbi:MAG: hypothetical protein ACI8PD_001399 [Nitrospinales bacterium]
MKYRYIRKEKRQSLGVYLEVTLNIARESCVESRKILAKGFGSRDNRKAKKLANGGGNSFEVIARATVP